MDGARGVTLHIDLETTSTVNLRKTGVFRYAEDPDTHVICACFKWQPGAVQVWRPGDQVPPAIYYAVEQGEPIHAHNAQFEATMWAKVLGPRHGWPVPSYDQFHCSMAQASYWGLPAALGDAGEALGLDITKDKTAHALMMRMSRPRGIDDDGTIHWWHEEDPQKLADLIEYCKRDVLAEKALSDALPPLPEDERAVWLLDQKMNRKGLRVDVELVEAMSRVINRANRDFAERMQEITGGDVKGPTAVAALGLWLSEKGVRLPDLKADTVDQAVEKLPDGPARDALRIRQDGSKTSTSKLKAFREAVCADGNVRGLLRYYGAARTGRWSGAGGARVQLQNLAKPTIKHVENAIALIKAGATPSDLELLFPESAMGVVASCMRGVLCA